MSYESYHIPSNFTDAGRLLGMFEIRNAVETALLTIPVLFLCMTLLPFAITTNLTVTLFAAVPVGGFCLVGISDDSLTRWVSGWWRWLKRRRIMLYRGEATRK